MSESVKERCQVLREPERWPSKIRPTRPAEVRETHISWLLFTDDHVLKIKKPVDLGFLDFTDRAARHRYCHEEVRLNRRLSPDVYLGVLAVRPGDAGPHLQGPVDLDDAGDDDLDYAVLMRRLPEEGWLDRRLTDGDVEPELMDRIATRIADFHADADSGPEITRTGALETVRANAEENFEQTRDYVGITLDPASWDAASAHAAAFLEVRETAFRGREAAGRIRDGHGDLHTAQICVTDGIEFIDCIEFNERFRHADVAADLAFTAMDIDFHGRPDLSARLVDAYVNRSGDEELRRVLPYYLGYRAFTRGKVESMRLRQLRQEDGAVDARREIIDHAGRYFELAHLYALPSAPLLVLVFGLMGTGKTTLAEALAPRLRAHLESSDRVRKELAGLDPHERRAEDWGEGLYSRDATERTYEELLRRAGERLRRDEIVLLDASFRERRWRRRARELGRDADAPVLLLETHCPPEVIRRRLGRRARRSGAVSDGRPELLDRQRESFESPDDDERGTSARVDTSDRPRAAARDALRSVHRRLL